MPGRTPLWPQSLSEAEEAACARFLRPADAELCREARFLLRHTLSGLLGVEPRAVEFRLRAGGKPELACPGAPPVQFNLSHTRGMALLAVTMADGAELGIDVESADRVVSADLLAAVLAPAERKEVLALPEAQRQAAFMHLWTLKEAVVKAAGLGLAAPVEQIVFDLAETRLLAVPPSLGAVPDYTVRRIALPNPYCAALAVLDRKRRPVVVELRPPL